MSKNGKKETAHRKKLTKIFQHIFHISEHEFNHNNLTDGEVVGFYAESLAMMVVRIIANPDYSKKDLNRILSSVSKALISAMEEGKKQRKQKEKK